MMSRSLRIDRVVWEVTALGEKVVVIQPDQEKPKLGLIHKMTHLIELSEIVGLSDVVPSYESIALIFDEPVDTTDEVCSRLSHALENIDELTFEPETHIVPVCYEVGLDWDEVCSHTGLTKQEVIKIHVDQCYTVAMMGFIPGFLYLDGLNESIHCPRKQKPRTKVPEGAIGIGGGQTGIYSLESPGGWQIIGRTPLGFFQPEREPPVPVKLGDRVVFKPISVHEFRQLTKEPTR